MEATVTLPRADLLDTPPVVGRFYMVPAILWAWHVARGQSPTDPDTSYKQWWPVIGPVHNDPEFFNFPYMHYHIDVRFIGARHLSEVYDRPNGGKFLSLISRPLNSSAHPAGPPSPTHRKMRCERAEFSYPKIAVDSVPVHDLNKHYAGTQCASGKRGWICPHRKVSLGSMVPDVDGVITCFLHGLRINVKTGACVGPAPKRSAS